MSAVSRPAILTPFLKSRDVPLFGLAPHRPLEMSRRRACWHGFRSFPLGTAFAAASLASGITSRNRWMERAVMKHRNSHLLVGYWSRLRNGRDVPDQTDIDPRAIKRMLVLCLHSRRRRSGRADLPPRGHRRFATVSASNSKARAFLPTGKAEPRPRSVRCCKPALDTQAARSVSSIGANAECGMVELETILAPDQFRRRRAVALPRHDAGVERSSPLAGRPSRSSAGRLPDGARGRTALHLPRRPRRRAARSCATIRARRICGLWCRRTARCRFRLDEAMRTLMQRMSRCVPGVASPAA